MAKSPYPVNLHLRLLSHLVLTVLLAWLTVQETEGASLNTRLYKYTTEQVAFQLDIEVTKETPVNPTLQGFSFISNRHCLQSTDVPAGKLIPDFLFINSFTRNPFYVQATINAP
jgi:hypothetical protein